jgi:hypothetical protein
VWRGSLPLLCFSWAVITASVVAIVVALASALRYGDAVSGLWDSLLPWVAGAGTPAFLIWRLGTHPAIIATPREVIVRNPWSTYALPWEEIRECSASYYGIGITGRRGGEVYAWAVPKWNLSIWLHRRTRADEVADFLMTLRESRGKRRH